MKKKCPKCQFEIPEKTVRLLRKQRTILCRNCFTHLQIYRKGIPLFTSSMGGVVGLFTSQKGIPIENVVVTMFIFAILFYLVFTRYIGFYYNLEEAEEDDF
jgi:hypothetical protein